MSASGSEDKPIDVTDELAGAFAHFHDPEHKRSLRRRSGSEDGYDAYDISMCAGWVSDYRNIFDFYVNLPDTKKPQTQQRCTWRTLERDVTIEQFLEFRGSAMRLLLDLVGSKERIQVGYVVSYTHGQLDEVTTWSRALWLFATERSFVYVNFYSTTIH